MSKTRRQFSKEYKLEAVRRSREPGVKVSTVARELGIRPAILYRWRSEHKAYGADQAFPGHGKPQEDDVEAENRRLRKELVRLQMEHEILKKAVRIFSRDQP
jgi:transposase